jgi:hypothetical protein
MVDGFQELLIRNPFIALLIVGFICSVFVDVASIIYKRKSYAIWWMIILTILYGFGNFLIEGC